MEGVERTNTAMVIPKQSVGFPQNNLYAMDVDRRDNRMCFACGGFGHMARFCRNRGMANRRIVMTLKLKVLSDKTTLVLSNTRELDRELFYKLVYLI